MIRNLIFAVPLEAELVVQGTITSTRRVDPRGT
jgi:hypothetical protein